MLDVFFGYRTDFAVVEDLFTFCKNAFEGTFDLDFFSVVGCYEYAHHFAFGGESVFIDWFAAFDFGFLGEHFEGYFGWVTENILSNVGIVAVGPDFDQFLLVGVLDFDIWGEFIALPFDFLFFVDAVNAGDSHFVEGERSGLVGADDGGGTKCFDGAHFADNGIFSSQYLDGGCEGESDDNWETFRNGGDTKGN